jgi:transcriptional regulator with XRE-family HTH domain
MEENEIKERIITFLKAENKTSAGFAQEIGVQPSGVSHIISGRNKPSLDFILKMLSRYNAVSPEWLLFGRGEMYRKEGTMELFTRAEQTGSSGEDIVEPAQGRTDARASGTRVESKSISAENGQFELVSRGAARITLFFEDNTFVEYFPIKK